MGPMDHWMLPLLPALKPKHEIPVMKKDRGTCHRPVKINDLRKLNIKIYLFDLSIFFMWVSINNQIKLKMIQIIAHNRKCFNNQSRVIIIYFGENNSIWIFLCHLAVEARDDKYWQNTNVDSGKFCSLVMSTDIMYER